MDGERIGWRVRLNDGGGGDIERLIGQCWKRNVVGDVRMVWR